MKKTYFSIFAFALTSIVFNQSFAQNVGINATGATPNASAMLDVQAADKGLLIPRVALTATNLQAPVVTPATSLLVYNTATASAGATQVTPGYYYWDGTKWVRFATGASSNHNTLNAAYNEGGPGAGRLITANSGAVEINHTSIAGGTRAMKITTNQANSFGLEVINSGTGVGVKAENNNPANTFAALQAETNSLTVLNSAVLGSNSGAGYGVSGQIPATATGAAGIFGNNLRTNGGFGVEGVGYTGVVGRSSYVNGYGVYGINTSTTNEGVGTYGIGNIGIYGETNNLGGWAAYFTYDVGVEEGLLVGGDIFGLGDIQIDGGVYADGPGVFNLSDSRLKSNITPIESALEKIMLIQPKHYTIKTTSTTNIKDGIAVEKTRQEFGVIAQELEKVFPEMISEKAFFKRAGDDTEYKSVNYVQLIPVLVQAMKEQQEMIESQNEKIEKLTKKIEELTK